MTIPDEVIKVIKKLQENNYEAYIVGGCVRDFLRDIEPEDWDVATNAKPKELQKIFPKSFYKNKFFTVTVQTDSEDQRLKEIEITTYRLEAKYTDKRHPDQVQFAETIEEDLSRRDFTINAMAIDLKSQIPNSKSQTNPKPEHKTRFCARPSTYIYVLWSQIPKNKNRSSVIGHRSLRVIDPFHGQKDLENKVIRAVGKPEERFSEDALRMLRAVRFATSLNNGWNIEPKTIEAIKKNSLWIEAISKERIKDELMKIIMAESPASGIELLRKLGLLKYIIPEIEEGYKVTQNKHHIYDCYEHYLKSLDYAAKREFNKYVRLAAFLHDVGKPRVKKGEGQDATFYNHEIVGAKMVMEILNRLKFSKKNVEKVAKLVRYHLFYYNPDEVGESSVRRLVREVGPENMNELLEVRMCDRIGSGVPKAEPYRLRHLRYIIEKVSRDPLSVKMLEVDGHDVMKILGVGQGPKIGQILDVLLSYVLSEPKKNKKAFLEKEIKKLGKMSEKELKAIAQKAQEERKKLEIKKDEMTKKKYWVT